MNTSKIQSKEEKTKNRQQEPLKCAVGAWLCSIRTLLCSTIHEPNRTKPNPTPLHYSAMYHQSQSTWQWTWWSNKTTPHPQKWRSITDQHFSIPFPLLPLQSPSSTSRPTLLHASLLSPIDSAPRGVDLMTGLLEISSIFQ